MTSAKAHLDTSLALLAETIALEAIQIAQVALVHLDEKSEAHAAMTRSRDRLHRQVERLQSMMRD